MEGIGSLPIGSIVHYTYKIKRVLGQGGMGCVYYAYHTELGQYRALKEMIPPPGNKHDLQEMQRLFLQEGRILRQLQNKHLPLVYDAFIDNGHWFLIMDYIDGETLADIQKRQGGPIPEARVSSWLEQLCDVLEYLHEQHPPVIFRDLKPSNIMLQRDGTLKLIDFGIARLFNREQSHDTFTPVTHGYSPLEQYGQGQTDQRSDIYALGKTIWTLLTGSSPNKNPSVQERMAREIVPDVSQQLDMLIQHMVKVEPSQRPTSIAEVRRELLPMTTLLHPISSPRSVIVHKKGALFIGVTLVLVLLLLTVQVLGHISIMNYSIRSTIQPTKASTTHTTTSFPARLPIRFPHQAVIYTISQSNKIYALDTTSGNSPWQYQLPQSVSQFIVANNRLYLVLSNNSIYAEDASSGTILWHHQMGSTVESLIATQKTIFISSVDEAVYALHANNGNLIWRYVTAGQNGVLLAGVTNNAIFAAADMGQYFAAGNTLYAIDEGTGNVLWSSPILETNSLPLVAGTAVYVGGDITGLAEAFQSSNGKNLWSRNASYGFSSPTLSNGVLYLSTQNNVVYALQAATGSILWQRAGAKLTNAFNQTPVVNGTIVYNWGDGYLYALRASDGTTLWQTTLAGSVPPVVTNNVVCTLRNGTLYAFQAETGSPLWHIDNGGVGQLLENNGVIYISTNNFGQSGMIYALNATNGSLLWKYQLDAPVITTYNASREQVSLVSQM